MKTLKIIQSGTPATAIVGNIQGMITAALIRFETVTYEFTYYNTAEARQDVMWLRDGEFICEAVKQPIGFKTNNQ